MNGLQSLMQGYNLGGVVGEQARQAPAMPNDPRMDAAMGLVDDSVEKFNLDPRTESLMLRNQALDLLKAADNVGKMNPPQQDANIEEQTDQGIAGMLQSLAPGMQQRGQQMQRSQARQMLGGGAPARPPMPQQNMARPTARPPMPQQNMARSSARPSMGGMPTMGAPNMARMADGGIVGYQEGGDVSAPPVPTPGVVSPKAVDREDIKRMAELYRNAQARISAATDPRAKSTEQQVLNDLKMQMGDQLPYVMQYIDSTQGSIAAPGMARGGIIGYRPGGKIELDEDLVAALPSRVEVSPPSYPSKDDRIAERERKNAVRAVNRTNQSDEVEVRRQLAGRGYDRAAQDKYIEDQKAKRQGALGDFSGLGSLRAPESFRMQGTNNPPEFRMQGMEEATSTVSTPYDPTGTKSAGLRFGAAQDTFVPPVGAPVTAPTASQEFTPDALDLLAEKELKAALNADPNEVATTRGDRFRELTGFDDLMARRIAAEASVRGQKESRLSPEETRKRRLQAGLAGLAERGLGGFGAGRTSEMDKIAAERLGIEETSLADLNSLIAEKRAMGMTQFEAENSARAEIQGSQDNAATAASRRADARRAEFANSQEKGFARLATAEQNRLNRKSNERVAALQVAGSNETDLVRRLNIRMAEIKEANPELSKTEIASRAMDMLEQQETSAALARVGIQASQQNFARYQGAAKIVIDRLANDLRWSTLSAAEQQAAYQTALDAEMRNIERILGDTSSTGGSSTGPTEAQLVQLRAANPTTSDAELIEFFKTL